MCARHWRRVPPDLQRAVRETHAKHSRLYSERGWQLSLYKMAAVREADAQHEKAVSDAIAAVEAKERVNARTISAPDGAAAKDNGGA